MPAIIPPEAVDVVGLIVSIIFLKNYVLAFEEAGIFDENSEKERRLALKRTAYWGGLASWNMAATEQIADREILIDYEPLQILFFDEPGLLMVISFILFMLPTLILLSGADSLWRVAVWIRILVIILIVTWMGFTFWGTLFFVIGAFL